MLGLILIVLSFAACGYLLIKMVGSMQWHNSGVGERKAKAEYGRIKREAADSPDAQISEGEFVDKFVNTRMKPWKYAVITLLVMLVFFPMSCMMMIGAS